MNKANRIAIVVPVNLFETNGSAIRARRIIPVIRTKYPVLVITRSNYEDSGLLDKMNIRREELKLNGQCSKNPYLDLFLDFLWNFSLIRTLMKSRTSIIYGQGLNQLPAYFIVSRLCKRKFVYEAHSLSHKEQAQTSRIFALFLYLMEFVIGKTAHGVIALSGEAHIFYQKLNRNLFYIPVFVDTCLYFNRQKTFGKTMFRQVGLIGPFNTKFNRYQFEFLRSNIEKFDKRITFHLIGKSDTLLNSDRIENLGYLKTEQDYIATLSKLDAIIVPLKIGTFGPKNKILEAMACSLPVFTTPNGILGLDFAEPDENILVFKENELVDKINMLLFDESFLKEIRQKARKTVERFYSKSICEEKILNMLEGVLNDA